MYKTFLNFLFIFFFLCSSTLTFAQSSLNFNRVDGDEVSKVSQGVLEGIFPNRTFQVHFVTEESYRSSQLSSIYGYVSNIILILKESSEDSVQENIESVTIHINQETISNFKELSFGQYDNTPQIIQIERDVVKKRGLLRDFIAAAIGATGTVALIVWMGAAGWSNLSVAPIGYQGPNSGSIHTEHWD